jgi:hypothetical protein
MGEKPKQFFPHKIVPMFPRGEYSCNEDEAKKNQGFNINNT